MWSDRTAQAGATNVPGNEDEEQHVTVGRETELPAETPAPAVSRRLRGEPAHDVPPVRRRPEPEPPQVDTVKPPPVRAPRRDEPTSADEGMPVDPTFRYEDLGLIGKGAMGEVRRVRDRDLNRVVAMKIVRGGRMKNRRLLARFIAEAQATAQLTHPGIVPIHELGVLPDGRFFFTMKEVKGKTLREVINELHGKAPAGPEEWTMRRVIDVFRRVCEAVAYAHARGVVHRDLKPDNVMVGSYGEVLTLDWGLAKVLGQISVLDDPAATDFEPVVTNRSRDSGLDTQVGTVAGTPCYMPPEQARGEFRDLGPEADVYALGAILYEIMLGTPPYMSRDPRSIIVQILEGPPPAPWRDDARGSAVVPRDLADLCDRCMRREPVDRFPHAGMLAQELGAWLEGSRKRETALQMVEEARRLYPEVDIARSRAASLRRNATRMLAGVPKHAAPKWKAPAWRLEDEAVAAERDAALKETEVIQLLVGAIGQAPDLDEARELLADYYRERHERAERMGHATLTARYEAMLRANDDGRHGDYLRGLAQVTVLTDPPGAQVVAYPYEERTRRLVPGNPVVLGEAPLRGASLPHGSWLLVLRAPGRAEVRYPVFVRRLEHWDGAFPGTREVRPVVLPHEDELTSDECYVAAGWFVTGGDQEGSGLPRRRVWVDGFVMQRFPVTNLQYVTFLNDLVATGEEQRALLLAPRDRGPKSDAGTLLLDRDVDGWFRLGTDTDGVEWRPDWPVTMVDWEAAVAYGEWLSERTGQTWRLPTELEWEKAARGVDGRLHPWGDFFDPSFACLRDSNPYRPNRVQVDAFPLDESPYGVRGMAGNVRDWCLDVYRAEGPLLAPDGRALVMNARQQPVEAPRAQRGGAWNAPGRGARVTARDWSRPDRRSPNLGFRLVRTLS